MSWIADDDSAHLREQLRELVDRSAIVRLCDSYVEHLDFSRDDDDWLSSVFTEDAEVIFPMGAYRGLAGLTEFQQMARANFARSHHIAGNYTVQLGGDHARVRAHLIAVHVGRPDMPGDHFDIGGHYEADVVRTTRGWRISRFVFDIVWMNGTQPGVEEARNRAGLATAGSGASAPAS
jgi:hypothetical protein